MVLTTGVSGPTTPQATSNLGHGPRNLIWLFHPCKAVRSVERFPRQNSHQLPFPRPLFLSLPFLFSFKRRGPKQATPQKTQRLTLIEEVGHWDTSSGLSCCSTRCPSWQKSGVPAKQQPRQDVTQSFSHSVSLKSPLSAGRSGDPEKKENFTQCRHFPDGESQAPSRKVPTGTHSSPAAEKGHHREARPKARSRVLWEAEWLRSWEGNGERTLSYPAGFGIAQSSGG